MMASSATLEIPGRASASMPRAENTARAEGESLAAMRTFRICASRGVQRIPRPVEPGSQRNDVLLLDCCAAPDAQTRRGRSMRSDVEGDSLFFEKCRKPPHCGELLGNGQPRKAAV